MGEVVFQFTRILRYLRGRWGGSVTTCKASKKRKQYDSLSFVKWGWEHRVPFPQQCLSRFQRQVVVARVVGGGCAGLASTAN